MKILLVDPEAASRDALRRAFAEHGDQVRSVGTIVEARRHLSEFLPDAVVAASDCADGDGIALLEAAWKADPRRAVFALVGANRLDEGVSAMERGAHDFLWRPISTGRVALLRSRLVARRQREGWSEEARLRLARTDMEATLIGRSAGWKAALLLLEREASLESPVLFTGEPGTEKEDAARALHRLSGRGAEPFTPLPDRETDATAFPLAGSLFVPALERVPAPVQRELASLVERGGIPRVIAATDRDPRQDLAEGGILPQLLDHFEGHAIHLPPLRERGGDVELLALHFLHGFDSTFHFEPEAMDALLAHNWPGNVRELKEAMRRASRLSDGPAIGPTVVTSVLGRPLASRRSRRRRAPVVRVAVGESLADVERRLIQKTLEFARGNKKKTAELLKLSLKTIYNKIKEYGIEH